jgi:quinol monooxygenase YgiN
MTENTGKLSAIVKLTAKPGRRDEIAAAFVDARPLVDAESGTEQYSLHLDGGDEDVAWVVEVYTDKAAFEVHSAGAVLASLGAALGDALAPGGFELHLTTPLPAKGIDT